MLSFQVPGMLGRLPGMVADGIAILFQVRRVRPERIALVFQVDDVLLQGSQLVFQVCGVLPQRITILLQVGGVLLEGVSLRLQIRRVLPECVAFLRNGRAKRPPLFQLESRFLEGLACRIQPRGRRGSVVCHVVPHRLQGERSIAAPGFT